LVLPSSSGYAPFLYGRFWCLPRFIACHQLTSFSIFLPRWGRNLFPLFTFYVVSVPSGHIPPRRDVTYFFRLIAPLFRLPSFFLPLGPSLRKRFSRGGVFTFARRLTPDLRYCPSVGSGKPSLTFDPLSVRTTLSFSLFVGARSGFS